VAACARDALGLERDPSKAMPLEMQELLGAHVAT